MIYGIKSFLKNDENHYGQRGEEIEIEIQNSLTGRDREENSLPNPTKMQLD